MRLIEGIAAIGADGRFAEIGAFVEAIGRIGDEHDVTIQAFDARYVVSERHLERAVEIADRERARGDGIVRDRAVEIALYAAGRRQIDQALEMGLSMGTTPAVVLIDGPGDESAAAEAVNELLDSKETLGAYTEARIEEFYDIGAAERGATDADLEALVLERVALLIVDR